MSNAGDDDFKLNTSIASIDKLGKMRKFEDRSSNASLDKPRGTAQPSINIIKL